MQPLTCDQDSDFPSEPVQHLSEDGRAVKYSCVSGKKQVSPLVRGTTMLQPGRQAAQA